jgi:hypothetical protein
MATGTIPKPDVFIKEVFVTTSPTLIPPALPVVVVGVNKQVEFKQNVGAYDSSAASYAYPHLPEGANVDTASVLAYLTNKYGTFTIANTDFSADEDSVDVEPNITITRTVIATQGTGETTATTTTFAPPNVVDGVTVAGAYTLTSASSTFETDGVKPGMSLFIVSGADEGIYQVASVDSETQLTVDLKSDSVNWKPFVGFAGSTGANFRFMTDGSSFVDNAADFLDDGVVPGMTLVIEEGINAGNWRVEKVVSDIELKLNQILLNTQHTGNPGAGTLVFTDTGKNFTTMGVQVGDILIIETGTDAAERTVAAVGTTTLTVSGVNFVGSASVDYRIVRIFENESNVSYRVDHRDSLVTGDVLISYTAIRTDNIGDLVSIETVDELESKVGPAIPENPLGFACFLALQNTDTIIYATAVEDDTTTDHLAAAEFLETREVYGIAVLSTDPAIHQIWKSHVDNMSDEESKRERICFINRLLFTYETKTSGDQGFVDLVNTFSADDGDFINDEVTAGMYVKLLVDGEITETARIVRVVDGQHLELVAPGLAVHSYHDLNWRIDTKALDKLEQAQFLADYSKAFADRRVYNVWPDEIQVSYEVPLHGDDTFDQSDTEVTVEVPGFFACAIVGAMVANYPPQQPFTNLPFAGIIGLQHSNEYFSPIQLDTIATGGTYIVVQDTPTAPCYSRHQLSTDISQIEKRELSITKDVDYVAKFLRNQLRPYIGKYNITQTFLEMLRTVVTGVMKNLIGEGQLIDGQLVSLVQSTDQPDTVLVTVDILVPYPCNYIRVTLLI